MAEVRVLGPVGLHDGERRSAPLAPRTRRLLAGLASRANSVASTDWLVDVVWPERSPATAGAALHTLVSRLRTAVRELADADVQVVTRPPGYLLRLPSGALDAHHFERLLRESQRLRSSDVGRAVALTERALALWRGPAYGEYADEDFARAESARLTELRADALEARADLLLQAGDLGGAQASSAQLVQEHPLRERPYRLLMVAQYRAGRAADALTTFAELRHRLADELGLDPTPESIELQRRVLANDPSLLPPPGPVWVATSPRSRGRVGQQLIGREHDLQELRSVLGDARLVTLVGPGGVGKTSLAFEVVDAEAGSYRDGAVICELSTVPAEAAIVTALGTALRLPGAGGDGAASRLVTYLASRELLLVLDNCEHVSTQVAAVVSELLRSCPDLTMLVTSRTVLRVASEVVFALQPLPAPPSQSPGELTASPAVQLFLRRAEQRVRGFAADDGTLAAIGELCRRLDGLPLALELAASRMDALTPQELLSRWQWRFTVLHGGASRDPRHRTLRALVDWSFERLAEPDRQVFEVVSVFSGAFSLADAESVLSRVDELGDRQPADLVRSLSELVTQSMVTRSPASSSYVLLETLRAYGRERLAAEPWAATVPRAHAQHYASLAADGYDDLYGAGQVRRVQRLEAAMHELRAAFWWAADQDVAIAAELVGGLAVVVEHKLVGEVAGWADSLIGRLGDRSLVPGLARVYAVAAAGARFAGDLARSARLAGTALELSGSDVTASGYARLLLCEAAFFAGDLERAVGYCDEVAVLAAEHEQLEPLLAMVDCSRALSMAYRGDHDGAAAVAAELQVLAARRGWTVVAAWAGYVQGEVLIDVAPERADRLLGEALTRARDLDERYLSGVALVAAASARSRHGDPHQAAGLFREVVQHWSDRADWTHQWTTLRNVVDLLVRLDRLEPAAVLVAGLTERGAPATGYGADAARLAETQSRLRAELDDDQMLRSASRGRSLTDHALVEYALQALDDQPLSSAAGRSGRS